MANMKPSPQLLELAKTKACSLQPGTQIRLGGSEFENSYWIMNHSGLKYIGTLKSEGPEELGKFFKNRPVYVMADKDNNVIGHLQRLI